LATITKLPALGFKSFPRMTGRIFFKSKIFWAMKFIVKSKGKFLAMLGP